MLTFTWIFLVAVVLHFAIESWLEARHGNHVASHRDAVPARFADAVSLEAHQKAADYTLAKLNVSKWSELYGLALLLIWTLGGGLAWLDGVWSDMGWGSIWVGTAFLISFALIGTLLDLPFSIYKTFVTEEKFGFNRMTAKLFVVDMIKGALLMLLIGVPIVAVILWLMDSAGNLWWVWAWAFWTGFSLFMMWAYPTLIAPIFNKFEPMEEGETKSSIEALLIRCGFESKGLFVMDGSKRSSHGNAYFTGFGKSKRIVFFDTLLKQLSMHETEAVLAHELGHFKHGHIRKRMLIMFATSLAGFALLGWLSDQLWFYQALGVPQASNHALLILFMLALPHFLFWMAPLSSWFSRKHEFEADAYAASHADAADLITALVKMYEDNASTLTPDPLHSAWHDSHPPAPVRVAHLESLMNRAAVNEEAVKAS
ncbi:MAG: M48 family metallopeptidase [Mariprofundaceae bacterium]